MKTLPSSLVQGQQSQSPRNRGWICSALLAVSLAGAAYSQTPDSFNPTANSAVLALAVQPDGRIVVGGGFSLLGGWSKQNLARLNTNGSLDLDFTAGANGPVYALAVQSDRKILVGGIFSTLGGQPRACLGRLNPDGSVDATFHPDADYPPWGGNVYCLAVQSDGKILVGGYFLALAGQPRSNLGRLNADGSLDTTFNPGAGTPDAGTAVGSLVVQTNGQILVGGSFFTLGGQSRRYLGRLNSDGTVDDSFDPQPDNSVYCLMVQPDNKILVGGIFTSMAGQPRLKLGRLHSDGFVDESFIADANAEVYTLALQANGRILVGGAFTNLAGQACNRLGRLESSGTLDASFFPDADANVQSLTIQPDGRVVVGGDFATIGGQVRRCIGRLENNDAANENLSFDGTNLLWSRTGACPEVCWAICEASTNGGAWTSLGTGMRISDGWQVGGLTLPSNATIRARGFLPSGINGGGGWFTELSAGPPVVTTQPASRTNLASTTTKLEAEGVGTGPLAYQWFKAGAPLEEGGKLSGTRTSRLTLSNVFGSEAGLYSLVITNSVGAVTSSVAILSVTDPWITNQPVARSVNLGQNATFSVTAVGTAPSYQWLKDGTNLSNRTMATLILTNAQVVDLGFYSVVVSNAYGSVTSAVAQLAINLAIADTFNATANGGIYALAVQTDGKILVGGGFSSVNSVSRGNLARLKPDGTLDTLFTAAANNSVFALGVQPDGAILAGGWFTSLGAQARAYLGRLKADGALDTMFNPGVSGGVSFPGIYAVVQQADGKILVGGDFRTLAGQSRTNLGRLHPNGTLDTNFNASAGSIAYSLALQPDGKILVGGEFTTLCGKTALRIGRLNSDGTLDTNFTSSASDIPFALALQPDGKIVAGGPFLTLAGQTRNRIGRLNPNGSLDTNFTPVANGIVRTVALQTDGRILVGGEFTTLGGQSRTNLARLNADGTLDPTFNPGANSVVYALTVQKDGQTLVGGSFGSLAGQPRSRLGRLTNTGTATDSITFDGASIIWLRGGTGPEIGRANFDISTNGINWVNLGNGERIAGGWQLTALDLPADASFRARGYVTGGRYSCSTWFLESTLNVSTNGPPVILTDNGHFGFATNRFGFDVAGLLLRGVIVDGSTNLKTWSPIWTNLLGNGPVYFSDGGSTNLPQRFYRARLQ